MSLEKRMDHLHWLQDVGGTFSSISGIACHSQCYNRLSPLGSGYEKTLFLLKKMMALMAAFGFVLVQDLVKECKQVHSPLSMKCERCLWMVSLCSYQIPVTLKPATILGIVMDAFHASAKSAEKLNQVTTFP